MATAMINELPGIQAFGLIFHLLRGAGIRNIGNTMR